MTAKRIVGANPGGCGNAPSRRYAGTEKTYIGSLAEVDSKRPKGQPGINLWHDTHLTQNIIDVKVLAADLCRLRPAGRIAIRPMLPVEISMKGVRRIPPSIAPVHPSTIMKCLGASRPTKRRAVVSGFFRDDRGSAIRR